MRWAQARRRFFSDLLSEDGAGATTASVIAAMQRAVLRGLALWQLVMITTVVIEPVPWSVRAGAVVGHLLLAVCALAVIERRLPGVVLVAASYALFLVDWWIVGDPDQPLLLAACWMVNVTAVLPAFLLQGRTALIAPVVAAVVVPTAMVLLWPDSGTPLPTSVATTILAITVASRAALPLLLDFAREADREHTVAADRQHALDVRRAASRRAAEDARVLHDTVINTLAALATGGAGLDDERAVRERCARDVATVEAMTTDMVLPLDGQGIRAGTAVDGIRVIHRGIGDDELARREALLPAPVLEALARASTELVRNAAKHSGADEVVVDIAIHDRGLAVTVHDDGVGFDGSAPEGRGLADSVVARLDPVDVHLELTTAPGAGTRARMTWRGQDSQGDPSGSSDDAQRALVDALQWRASGLFALCIVVVGLWLALTNHRGEPTEEYPMVAVVAGVGALAWFLPVGGLVRQRLVPVLLTVAACVAFVLSAAAVGFGRDDIVLWQAICPSGPLLLLLGERRWSGAGRPAVVAVALTIVGLAVLMAPTDLMASVSILVAGCACLGLVGGWRVFQWLLARIGRQLVADSSEAHRLRIEADSRDAASRARRRWTAAGLGESVAILRQVAGAEVDPRAEELRSTCATEEVYLRQLTQLHPDLVQMGDWFAQALADSRSGECRLAVRSGGVDVSADLAPALGDLLLQAVSAVPPGAQVTSTLFPAPDGLRFTLVGPGPHLADVAQLWLAPAETELSIQRLGAQDLVEVVVPLEPSDADR